MTNLLSKIQGPEDIKSLSLEELNDLSKEIRETIVETVTKTGGHLGSNLGIVELTIAMHRVFNSPHDVILFDTGHQSYVHKLLTGRYPKFPSLRQEGGLSGYPSRRESPHDWVENSHASTVLSYAHGLATSFSQSKDLTSRERKVVAVIGDGALTGGLAYEALNNLGHSGCPVLIVLNDNGRSYAPTISRLSLNLTKLRLHPSYITIREKLRNAIRDLPVMGEIAYSSVHGITSALREIIEPHIFFESLGVRYVGPIDGHDIAAIENALKKATFWNGPIVLHVLTDKGKGYSPAEDDEIQRLHDYKIKSGTIQSFTESFSDAIVQIGDINDKIVAITAAMPSPTGLLTFQNKYPERFFDVGIAEEHAVTFAAGLAMGGLHPVVAIYSTFFSRAFDQFNLDVGLHELPVTFVLDRAGITGDDGPSHNGVLDLVLSLSVPNVTIFTPSNADEIFPMLLEATRLRGPSVLRFPKTPSPPGFSSVGEKLRSKKLRSGKDLIVLAVGKLVKEALEAAEMLSKDGIDACVYDVRVVRPADEKMLNDALNFPVVVTVEDGYKHGGAGDYLVSKLYERVGNRNFRHLILGLETKYFSHAKPDVILGREGLLKDGIYTSIKNFI